MAGIFVVGVVVGFIIVVFILAGKENKDLNIMVSKLNDEQKNKLSMTDVNFIEGKNEWVQQGMISEINDKGSKVALKVLWFNRVIQNNSYNKIVYADVTIKKEDFEKYNLKYGDFVKLHIAPERTTGVVSIIWE